MRQTSTSRSSAGIVARESLTSDFGMLLIDGEVIRLGFADSRNSFVFTSKRLIISDIQGLVGNKMEFLSIPYRSITRFSIESAGAYDLDGELKMWIGTDAMPITKYFNSNVDMYELQSVLASHVLR